jgi:hypothetical protein
VVPQPLMPGSSPSHLTSPPTARQSGRSRLWLRGLLLPRGDWFVGSEVPNESHGSSEPSASLWRRRAVVEDVTNFGGCYQT